MRRLFRRNAFRDAPGLLRRGLSSRAELSVPKRLPFRSSFHAAAPVRAAPPGRRIASR
jgi:hypothetical protein